ncbi:MAG: amino acid permease [Nanoarchaeota archaeon]|nr:amino acid permease [Nanoarchaeota archaeon]
MGKSRFWFAVALMIGTVAGASVLGFPYVFAKVGFLTGLLTLIIVGSAATLMTLYIAELSLIEKKKHHLAGFAKKYFGNKGKLFTLLVETFGIYTALIAYLIAVGIALADLLGGSPIVLGTLFFVIVAALILFNIKRVAKVDMFFAALKIFLLLFFGVVFFSSVNISNVNVLNISKVFYPFGIVLFACMGYNVIPEMLDILKDKRKIGKAILTAMVFVIGIYLLFSYSLLGSVGKNVNEVAVVGLPAFGKIGDLFVLIAITIPFIALADAIKHIYTVDFGLHKKLSWFLSAFIPFIIYVYVKLGFVTFLQISGTYSGGLMGLLTMFMVLKARQKKKKSRFVVPGGNIPIYYSIAVFAFGIIYQTLMLLL